MPTKPRATRAAGRKRRTLGWTLLTLGLFVAGMWVWSMYWHAWCTNLHIGGVYSDVAVLEGKLHVLSGSLRPLPYGWGRLSVFEADPYHHPFRWRWVADKHENWNNGEFTNLHLAFHSEVSQYDSTLGRPYTYRVYGLFIWHVPLLLWTPAALLLRSGIVARRRAITGKCKACGYDLAGLEADVPCPECGKQIAQR